MQASGPTGESWDGRDPDGRRSDACSLRSHTFSPLRGATQAQLALAPHATHNVRADANLRAVTVVDGDAGGALFIPLDDAPTYPELLATLAAIAAGVVRHARTLLTLGSTGENAQGLQSSIASNRVAHFTSLPYAVAATTDPGIVTPLRRDESSHRKRHVGGRQLLRTAS